MHVQLLNSITNCGAKEVFTFNHIFHSKYLKHQQERVYEMSRDMTDVQVPGTEQMSFNVPRVAAVKWKEALTWWMLSKS